MHYLYLIVQKIPLSLTLSRTGRGDSFVSPPLMGGDEGEGVFSFPFLIPMCRDRKNLLAKKGYIHNNIQL